MLYHHFFLLALSPGLVRLLLYCYTKVDNPTINLPTMGILYTTTYHRSPSRATKAGQPRRAPGSRQAAAASLTRPAGGGMGWGKSWGNVGICGKPWETQKPSKTYHLEMIYRFWPIFHDVIWGTWQLIPSLGPLEQAKAQRQDITLAVGFPMRPWTPKGPKNKGDFLEMSHQFKGNVLLMGIFNNCQMIIKPLLKYQATMLCMYVCIYIYIHVLG